MAKFCGKCGARLDEQSGKCPNCDIKNAPQIQEPTPPVEAPKQDAPEQLMQVEDVFRQSVTSPEDASEVSGEKRPNTPENQTAKEPEKKSAKKEGRARKKASPKATKKTRRIVLSVIAIVLCASILLSVVAGALVYFGVVDIPFVEKGLAWLGIEDKVEDVYRDLPETNDEGFTLYQSPEENIVEDTTNGFTYVNNEILVTLIAPSYKYELETYLDEIGGTIVGEIPEIADYQIQLNREYSYDQLKEYVNDLERRSWVRSASLNYALELDESYTPNDKKWKNKWGTVPDGINWGVEAIDADEAWDYRDEMEQINVGVIDNMFDLYHEDLVFAETPLGMAKVNLDLSNGSEWNDHGTHTAGTIAATFNNKKGIAGVSVGNNLYGVAVRGLESRGYSTVQVWKVAFYYLIVTNDCKAINVSMGYEQLTFEASREERYATSVLTEYSSQIGDFLQILIDLDYEFVICKSAGNQNEVGGNYQYFRKDSDDTNTAFEYYSYSDFEDYLMGVNDDRRFDRYRDRAEEIQGRVESGNVDADYDILGYITEPEVKERIIVVGSVRNLGTHKEGGFLGFGRTTVHDGYEIAASSQCGKRVDVLAPGVDIYSTIKRGYAEISGTSMAAPHVTGVAAMVFSINPDLSGSSVKKIICDTAVGRYGSERYGLLNAEKAVLRARDYDENDQQPIRITSDERDVVLVLDTSGSMSGTPITEVKKAASSFVSTVLDEEASIGLVEYSDYATMISDFTVQESYLQDTIDNLGAGGGTNIEDGLQVANSMLQNSKAKKKIIVLMSDGEPNEGKEGEALISYADSIKEQGISIYTLGFFEDLGYKYSAQTLMEGIASDGCHYEVDDADSLLFFFDDIADQINGQKYIYIRIACPVDVTVKHNGEKLCSTEGKENTRTSFGSLTFEENDTEAEDSSDNRVKVLRLREGVDYDIQIRGNGRGRMDYTIGFMDDDGEYSDLREFRNIKITKRTAVDTVAGVSKTTVLNVDEDGDGKYDLKYKAKANSRGKLVDNTYIIYIVLGVVVVALVTVAVVVGKKKAKEKPPKQNGVVRKTKFCGYCGAKMDDTAKVCGYCGKAFGENNGGST